MKNKKTNLIRVISLWLIISSICPFLSAESNKISGCVKLNTEFTPLAGSMVPIEFEVTAGDCGLKKGGRIEGRWEKYKIHHNFKIKNVTFVPDEYMKNTVFDINEVFPRYDRKNRLFVATLVEGPDIPAGSKILFKAQLCCPKHTNFIDTFSLHISPEFDEKLMKLDGEFKLGPVKNGPAHSINCIAEARPLKEKPGRVIVAIVDQYKNPVIDFRGNIELSCNTEASIPQQYTFTEEDEGSHKFLISFPKDKVSRITVKWEDLSIVSNPVLPRNQTEPGIYFGDIHAHSIFSDGTSDPDSGYEYAENFSCLDFAAFTDHSNYPTFNADGWKQYMEIANRYNSDGNFVTFIGYEWTHSKEGHRNIIYRGDEVPRPIELKHHFIEDVWADMDKKGIAALTVCNHPNLQATKRPDGTIPWRQLDLSKFNHHYQRLVEIRSFRGYETAGPNKDLRIEGEDLGSSVQTALAMGHRFGFVGSTDTHNTRPGFHTAEYAGRCAVISKELTRRNLWDTLYKRSCYATTGAHIILFFTVNGQPMGSEVIVSSPETARNVKWRAIGTAPIKRVDLLRNNIVVKSWEVDNTDDMSGSFSTSEPITETEWWYLRVIQQDTHLAWSSPVWIDYKYVNVPNCN